MSGECSYFIHRWKYQKTFSFLVFSGAIKWGHLSEIGSDIIDLPLAKNIRLKGFTIAAFLYELNTGVCDSIF